MKIAKVLPYLVVAILVLFIFTNETITSALINFMMAGVVPGTSIQLPWYAVLVLVPLLLFGVWQLIRSIDFIPRDWVAPQKTTTKKASTSKKRTRSRRNTNAASTKRKQSRKSTTKRSSKKVTALTQAEA